MSKLTESFNKTESIYSKLENIIKEIEYYERDNKDNKILTKYVRLLRNKETLEKQLADMKNIMYTDMLEEDIDLLEGKCINVKLKKPYVKSGLDTKKFLKDNPKGSKLYNKYYKETVCKGNVTIKEV